MSLPGVNALDQDTSDPNATVTIEGKQIVVVVRKGDKGDQGEPGPTSLVNPMTTLSDLIIGGIDGAPARLPIGAEGQVPTVFGGVLVYRTPPAPSGVTNATLLALGTLGAGVANGILRKVGVDTWTIDTTVYVSDIDVVAPLQTTEGATPTVSMPAATDVADGYMPKEAAAKLAGVAPGANNYQHPATHPASIIMQDTNSRFTTDAEKEYWNAKQAALGFTPFANPMTGISDLIIGGALGVATRLPIGAEGQVPMVFGGALVYKDLPTGSLANPMTAVGDMIVGGTGGAPTRMPKGNDGTLYGVMSGVPGYYNPSTLGLSAAGTGVAVVSGMDNMGASDSTAALLAAIAALPSTGGVIVVPDPKFGTGYKFNLAVVKSGVQVIGPGRDANGGYRCFPWDTNKPVIQFGNDAGDVLVKFASVRDFYLYGGNTGKYGIRWQPGAQYCTAVNMGIRNFNTCHAAWLGGTALATQFNFLDQFCIETSATFADGGVYPVGLLFEDQTDTGSGWVTACYASRGNINVGQGYSIVIDSAAADIQQVYVDQAPGHGVVFRNNGRYTPTLACRGLILDTGVYEADANLSVGMVLDCAYDLRGNTAANHLDVISGNSDFMFGDDVMFVVSHTTGSISAGQTSLVVASNTNLTAGRQVIVARAGVGGANLVATVTAVSGNTATLSVAASTTVTASDVSVGNVSAEKAFKGRGTTQYMNPPGIWLTPNGKMGLDARGSKGQLYKTGASGPNGPWAGVEHVWDFGINDGLNLFSETTDAAGITSLVRVGNVVTATASNAPNVTVGDFITVDGAVEDGFNGTFPIATVVDTTHFTYISPVTQDTTASGTIVGIFSTYIKCKNGKLELPCLHGLSMRNKSGVRVAVAYNSLTSAAFYWQTPDTVNGSHVFLSGTGLGNNTTAYSWQAMNVTRMRMTSNGHLWLASTGVAPTNISGGAFYYVDTNGRHRAKDAAGNDGAIVTTACSAITSTTAAPTLTASTSLVMMGCSGTITPLQSTRLLVTISGQMANSVAGSGVGVELRYGTGTKPANGAAASGTVVGIVQEAVSVSAGQKSGFSITGIITGLTPGTAVWLDAAVKAITSGNATITGVTVSAVEV